MELINCIKWHYFDHPWIRNPFLNQIEFPVTSDRNSGYRNTDDDWAYCMLDDCFNEPDGKYISDEHIKQYRRYLINRLRRFMTKQGMWVN